MKILLVSAKTTESKGGIAAWTDNYLSACEANRLDVHIVNTATLGARSKNLSAKRSLTDEWKRTRRIMKELKEKLCRYDFDIAHVNTSIGVFGIIRDYFIVKKIVKNKIPVALNFHCDIPFWVTNKVIKFFLGRILKLSAKNFVLCENSKIYLEKEFGAEGFKTPNFVPDSIVKDKKNINENIKKMFFVGRISKLKGAEEIFELAKEFPHIEFELAGEICDGIENWTKPDNITFVGILSHEEVLTCMDNADIFIFPTYTEGFSMALAESMARGLPVITTNTGANLDMIENEGGIVVNVGDTDAMKKAIETMKDMSIREKMSEWNIKKIKSEYITEAVIKKLLKYYREYDL